MAKGHFFRRFGTGRRRTSSLSNTLTDESAGPPTPASSFYGNGIASLHQSTCSLNVSLDPTQRVYDFVKSNRQMFSREFTRAKKRQFRI